MIFRLALQGIKSIPKVIKSRLTKPRYLLFGEAISKTSKARSFISNFSIRHLFLVWFWEIIWASLFNIFFILIYLAVILVWESFIEAESWSGLFLSLFSLVDYSFLSSFNFSYLFDVWQNFEIPYLNTNIKSVEPIIPLEIEEIVLEEIPKEEKVKTYKWLYFTLIWVISNVIRTSSEWIMDWETSGIIGKFLMPIKIFATFTFVNVIELFQMTFEIISDTFNHVLPDTTLGQNIKYWLFLIIGTIWTYIKNWYNNILIPIYEVLEPFIIAFIKWIKERIFGFNGDGNTGSNSDLNNSNNGSNETTPKVENINLDKEEEKIKI